MRESFVNETKESYADFQDFVVNDEFRQSMREASSFNQNSKPAEHLRCLSPSSSLNYFKGTKKVKHSTLHAGSAQTQAGPSRNETKNGSNLPQCKSALAFQSNHIPIKQ